jgi:hypothetical protein
MVIDYPTQHVKHLLTSCALEGANQWTGVVEDAIPLGIAGEVQLHGA